VRNTILGLCSATVRLELTKQKCSQNAYACRHASECVHPEFAVQCSCDACACYLISGLLFQPRQAAAHHGSQVLVRPHLLLPAANCKFLVIAGIMPLCGTAAGCGVQLPYPHHASLMKPILLLYSKSITQHAAIAVSPTAFLATSSICCCCCRSCCG
jgi:hypothetical protein